MKKLSSCLLATVALAASGAALAQQDGQGYGKDRRAGAPAATTAPSARPVVRVDDGQDMRAMYSFVDLKYGLGYIGVNNGRLESDRGYSIVASYNAWRALYLFASYQQQKYEYDDPTGYSFDLDIEELSGGFGAHFDAGPASLFLAASYESETQKESESISGLGSSSSKTDADGYGVEAGVRGLLPGGSAMQLSYKYRELTDKDVEDLELHTQSLKFGFTLPFSDWAAVTADAEIRDHSVSGGSSSEDMDEERYMIGLRFQLPTQ